VDLIALPCEHGHLMLVIHLQRIFQGFLELLLRWLIPDCLVLFCGLYDFLHPHVTESFVEIFDVVV
jgi:hypothetical protein